MKHRPPEALETDLVQYLQTPGLFVSEQRGSQGHLSHVHLHVRAPPGAPESALRSGMPLSEGLVKYCYCSRRSVVRRAVLFPATQESSCAQWWSRGGSNRDKGIENPRRSVLSVRRNRDGVNTVHRDDRSNKWSALLKPRLRDMQTCNCWSLFWPPLCIRAMGDAPDHRLDAFHVLRPSLRGLPRALSPDLLLRLSSVASCFFLHLVPRSTLLSSLVRVGKPARGVRHALSMVSASTFIARGDTLIWDIRCSIFCKI